MPLFNRYIGVDYSGRGRPTDATSAIRVFSAKTTGNPQAEGRDSGANWSRASLGDWVTEQLKSGEPTIVGIDHGFSFPRNYLELCGWSEWCKMLASFSTRWPTDQSPVMSFRQEFPKPDDAKQLRLCESWTGTAKSVLDFTIKQGQVATSTHAGIPWLNRLRQDFGDRICFWPFDELRPEANQHVVAEVYPAWLKGKTAELDSDDSDQRDAYRVCRWIQERDRADRLLPYLTLPTLTPAELETARLEGWILGVV